jgi:hypothetical protein
MNSSFLGRNAGRNTRYCGNIREGGDGIILCMSTRKENLGDAVPNIHPIRDVVNYELGHVNCRKTLLLPSPTGHLPLYWK